MRRAEAAAHCTVEAVMGCLWRNICVMNVGVSRAIARNALMIEKKRTPQPDFLSSVGGGCCQWLAVEGVSVEGFGAEVEIGSGELLGLAQEQVSAGFKIEVQALD